MTSTARTSGRWPLVIAAGVAAAVHIWKVPPFIADISAQFGTSLVDAGVLLGIVQLAGVVGGLFAGLAAERIGFRRCLVAGLAILTVASIAGAFVPEFWMLVALRGVESVGFLLAVVAGPGIIRTITALSRRSVASGAWGSYQGIAALGTLGVAAALADIATREAAWVVAGAVTAVAAVAVLAWIPADRPRVAGAPIDLRASLARTVRSGGVVASAALFAAYAAAWMSVLGFLPTILGDAGADPALANLLSGIASGVNVLGNIGAGLLLHRGAPARLLLSIGAVTMAVSSVCIFALGLPAVSQFAFVLVFSSVAGLIPGTLFPLVLAVTPQGGSTTTAIGLLMQCSNAGMLFGPPVLAAITTATGTWASSWWFTAAAAAAALVLAQLLGGKRLRYDLSG